MVHALKRSKFSAAWAGILAEATSTPVCPSLDTTLGAQSRNPWIRAQHRHPKCLDHPPGGHNGGAGEAKRYKQVTVRKGCRDPEFKYPR